MRSLLALACIVLSSSSCAAGVSASALEPGVKFSACVLVHAAKDAEAKMGPEAAVVEILSACGGDAISIATVLEGDLRAHPGNSTTPAFQAYADRARS